MQSKYLEKDEVTKLRQVMSERQFLPLWVSLETGLRVGDVVAIKRTNVKADGIHYRAQKTNKYGVAPISRELREALAKSGKWLFPSPKNPDKHITRLTVWHRIKSAGKRVGLDLHGVSPHAMRKVFAVELYKEQGFKAVKQALQHNNNATTEIYTFSDWTTGENANIPLQRKDLALIITKCLEALTDTYTDKINGINRPKKGD
jgi:integrase